MNSKRIPLLALMIVAAALTFSGGCPRRTAVPAPNADAPSREERLILAYAGEEGRTALELLKSRARVRTSTSDLGELVEEINGVRSGEGYNLIYFVNGAMAKTGAGNYVTRTGERIEWKLIGPRRKP
jgi:hypothetical protein